MGELPAKKLFWGCIANEFALDILKFERSACIHVLLTTRLLKKSCSTLQGLELVKKLHMSYGLEQIFFMSRFTINLWPIFFNFLLKKINY